MDSVPRLHMSAGDGLGRLFQRGDVSEGQSNEWYVVINGLRNSNDGNWELPPTHFLVDRMGAALCPIATQAEQDVDSMIHQRVHHHRRLLRPTGCTKDGPTQLVNRVHETLIQPHRVQV